MLCCYFLQLQGASVFEVSDKTIDVKKLRSSIENPKSGGVCIFEGWVRNQNEGRNVEQLEYEVYKPLAIIEGEKIIDEAKNHFLFLEAVCSHRSGLLNIGDCAVWVGVSSKHRDEAFKACRFIIDEIKIRLPIWKKEYYLDGDSGWVNCERCANV